MVVGREKGPVFYAKWRDSTGRHVKLMLGPAWVDRVGLGWQRRRGRVPDGSVDERAATIAMGEAIRAYEAALQRPRTAHRATFAEAAAVWLHHLEHVEDCKPFDARRLRPPPCAAEHAGANAGPSAGGPDHARLRERPLTTIAAGDIGRFLATLDAEPSVGPRTVNKHRQVLCGVFEHAMREDTFRLAANPARRTDKRREPDDRPIDFYEPEEVLALARAARDGLHRDPRRPAISVIEVEERRLADEQDAAVVLVAAFAGLRLGELLALRWHNVNFADAKLIVESSWSSASLSSPKSRKWRAGPLADQPAAALERLSRRERFIGREDLVSCSVVGEYLDPSALRRRYRRAQRAAGLRSLRFHDLRHSFGSLVIREFDPVAVQDFMGHAKIATTERYLHARPRRTDAARLTKAFAGTELEREALAR